MLGKLILAAGLVAMAAAFTPSNASAAPAVPQSGIVGQADAGSLVQQAKHYRRHHHRHYRRYYGGTCWVDGVYVCGSSYRYRSHHRHRYHRRHHR